MKLYVIRHGRTEDNDKGVFNGRHDEDINETGIKQAELMSTSIAEYNIDLVICSPMKRTRHTAEIINTKGIPVVYDDRLMERDTGEFTLKPLKSVDREEYWNYYSTKYEGKLESVKDITERVSSFLDEIKEKYSDKNILIVTHNGITRAIYAYFNGVAQSGSMLNAGVQENCEVKEYYL